MPILNIDRDTLTRFRQSTIEGTILRGIIGKKQSDGSYAMATRFYNEIAVTLDDGTWHYANANHINARVAGAEVDLTRRGNQLIIVGDSTRGASTSDRSVSNAPTTIRGYGAEQNIDTLLIAEGLVQQQASSLTVKVLPLTYRDTDGNITRLTDVNYVDLTSSVPGTSNQRRWVIIALDTSDGTLSAINGTAAVGSLTASGLATTAASLKQHEVALAAIDLRNGDTTIYWNRITEGRLFAPNITLPVKVTVTSATYTVTNRDTHVFVNYAGAVTITLPAASDTPYNQTLIIEDVSGSAGTNNITINRAGSDTINGGTSTTINTDYGSVELITNSTSAWSLSQNSGGSGMTSFTLAGDSGGGQSIGDSDTLTIAGGEGVVTADSATDTVTVSADINSLTADASPDGAADYVMTYDGSAAAHKKVLLNNLPGGGSSPLTTKGDLYTYTTVDARLPVGTDGQLLKADSAQSTGLAWTTISGSKPDYSSEAIKTLSSGVATVGSDRNCLIAAETGTTDDLIEISGLSNGESIILRADAGDTITVKHNDAGATNKIYLYGNADVTLDEQNPLELVQVATNVLAQPIDQNSGGGGGATITHDTYANLPSAGNSGDLYIGTDNPYIASDNGSTWDYSVNGIAVTPPVLGNYTWENQGNATAVSTYGGIYIENTVDSGSVHVLYKTAPSAPYTIDVYFRPMLAPMAAPSIGAGWRDSTTQELYLGMIGFSSTDYIFDAQKWNTYSSYNSSYTLSTVKNDYVPRSFIGVGIIGMRFEDDNTNLNIYITDGKTYVLLYSVARTNFLTPDQVCFFLRSASATYFVAGHFLGWDEA